VRRDRAPAAVVDMAIQGRQPAVRRLCHRRGGVASSCDVLAGACARSGHVAACSSVPLYWSIHSSATANPR